MPSLPVNRCFTESCARHIRSVTAYSVQTNLSLFWIAAPGLSKTHNRHSPEVAPATGTRHHSSNKSKGKEKASEVTPAPDNRYKRKADEAEEEIQALKAELEKTKRQQNALMTDPAKLYSSASAVVVYVRTQLIPNPMAENKPAPAASKVRGVSLANPTKKARKYKPLEFESDDDA